MMPRKKMEYYAKQCGVDDFAHIHLTEDDCEKICAKVGVPLVHARDIGESIATLISVVMDDPGYIDAHRKEGVPDDLILMRCSDYAARDVFSAYKELH